MLKQYQGKHYLVLSEGVIAQHERTMKKRRRKIVPEKLNWKPPVFTRCVSLFWSALLPVLLKNFGGFLSERHVLFKEVLFLESALALTNSFLFPFESLHFSFAIHQRATSVRLVIDQKDVILSSLLSLLSISSWKLLLSLTHQIPSSSICFPLSLQCILCFLPSNRHVGNLLLNFDLIWGFEKPHDGLKDWRASTARVEDWLRMRSLVTMITEMQMRNEVKNLQKKVGWN